MVVWTQACQWVVLWINFLSFYLLCSRKVCGMGWHCSSCRMRLSGEMSRVWPRLWWSWCDWPLNKALVTASLFKGTRVTTDDSSGSVLFLVWKETMNESRPGDLHLSRRLVTACLPGCDTRQDLRSEDKGSKYLRPPQTQTTRAAGAASGWVSGTNGSENVVLL